MKKRMKLLGTASFVAIAGMGTYTVWSHNSSANIADNTAKFSAGVLSSPPANEWGLTQIQQQIEQQIQQEIQQGMQQLEQQPGGQQLVSFFTNSTGQLLSQVQRQLQQQEQLESEWQQEQSQTQPQGQVQPAQSLVQSQSQTQSGQTVSLPANTQPSGNWSGYIDTPSTSTGYTSISGSWTVPNISGTESSVAAQWIGLGGVTNHDLLQMGTMEQFQNGQPVADIFWEKLPTAAKPVMTVPIGSTIQAKVSKVSGSTWDITFTVKPPSGNAITKTIPVSVSNSYAQGVSTSAEWISEDPSNGNHNLYPLANMGTVNYSGATVDGQAFDAAANQVTPVALMDNYGDVLMAPSAVGSDGESFSTETLGTGIGAGSSGVTSVGGGQTLIPGSNFSQGWGWRHGRRHVFDPDHGYRNAW
ncbi:G1 family glutamic endopeptidase [Alicyclobacillus ferrooxydans]|uniref:G1 family glutamic endopeptidase n=1 Tax=Alicyclobacillus ferrooxydans TaxID=471514 RepID=UPI0006D58214|nr:G1 family glutamic endopeptidase [Alicyclobacillus ferrooxydans]